MEKARAKMGAEMEKQAGKIGKSDTKKVNRSKKDAEGAKIQGFTEYGH
jgi:hypothetical protein